MSYAPIISGTYLGNPSGISAFAGQQTALAHQYILRLGSIQENLTPPTITPEFPTVTSPAVPTTLTPPTLETPVWTAPAIPAAFTGTLEIDDIMPEAFDEDPPSLIYPAAPAIDYGSVPDAPGINLTFDDPTLSLTLPAPPNLMSLTISNFAGVTIPDFEEEVPELSVVAPSIREYEPGDGYTSELLTALQETLLDRIQNGGTGIPADVEEAIWNRGRDREARANRDALLKLEQMEGLGYALPPGVYLDARLKLMTETAYTEATISRDIMIKQAELEQENIKTALTLAISLEGKLIDYTNSVEQRLFESCRYATQAGVEIYNAQVRAYGAYVDAYKTKVAIYDAQIKGEMSKVEVYRAQLQAEEAKAQINTALVQQYKVQVDAALANVEVYKAQIAAIQTKAEIEKTKVQVFGEQVRAFTAKVNAYTAGVEGFRAQINAEATKQEAYKAQVQAYSAQVDAAARIIGARIDAYKGQITAKTAEYDGYKSVVQAESARVQAINSTNQARADMFKAEVASYSSYNELMTKQWQVALEQAQRTAEIGINTAKMNAELYMTTRSLASDAAKVGAQVAAQLGAAAVNAINWSTSIGYQNSSSTNVNYNYSASI